MYKIWAEGYRATGESGDATYMGTAEGTSFTEAVKNLFETRSDANFLNEDCTAFWGCRLFDNKAAARKAFG